MSYFGLASYQRFNIYDWLVSQIPNTSFRTAEQYAEFISLELTNKYRQLNVLNNPNSGLGIHFSCYEFIEGQYYPELFFITNFHPTVSGNVNYSGFNYSRETYSTLSKTSYNQNHRNKIYREKVKQFIDHVGLIWFNNGDPILFNPAANAIFESFMTLNKRGYLKQPFGPKESRSLARRPVEVVKNVQKDFCDSKYQIVGGKIHDLSITPKGAFESSTGDA